MLWCVESLLMMLVLSYSIHYTRIYGEENYQIGNKLLILLQNC
jgi:hypothetical protein